MWNVTTKLTPVIIRTTGSISKSLAQYLSNILEKHEIKEPQKTAILCTAHILLKVLTRKHKIFNMVKLDCSVYTCLTKLYGGRDIYNLVNKEQLHVSALFISHLQVDK